MFMFSPDKNVKRGTAEEQLDSIEIKCVLELFATIMEREAPSTDICQRFPML